MGIEDRQARGTWYKGFMSQLVTWVPYFILSREEMLGRKKRIWNRREHVTNISLVADIKGTQIKFRSLLYLSFNVLWLYTKKGNHIT